MIIESWALVFLVLWWSGAAWVVGKKSIELELLKKDYKELHKDYNELFKKYALERVTKDFRYEEIK